MFYDHILSNFLILNRLLHLNLSIHFTTYTLKNIFNSNLFRKITLNNLLHYVMLVHL